jgi:hypothetical protein
MEISFVEPEITPWNARRLSTPGEYLTQVDIKVATALTDVAKLVLKRNREERMSIGHFVYG